MRWSAGQPRQGTLIGGDGSTFAGPLLSAAVEHGGVAEAERALHPPDVRQPGLAAVVARRVGAVRVDGASGHPDTGIAWAPGGPGHLDEGMGATSHDSTDLSTGGGEWHRRR